ncbi:MAG: SURF1 family protein [Gammaproteobacteria bacterium]
MTLLTVIAAVAFANLGRWQWNKGDLRATQAAGFARGAGIAEPLPSNGALDQVPRFQRVRVTGQLDPAHQVLLDNRTNEGRPGYEVLTPLNRDGHNTILVNRGWVPFSGFRDKLPDVSFSADREIEITGRVDELPVEGLASGHAAPDDKAPWPKVTSYPTPMELAQALGRHVESRIVLLDASSPNGYVRDWQPPGLTADRHWSYGVQWYAFAVLAVALWLILGFRKRQAT